MHNVAQRWDGLSICDIPCGTLVVNVASLACGQVCELSDDHWHHADESDYLKVSEGRDGTYAVRAKCKYCHKEFIATGLTADSLSTAYSDYVNTLPAQGYDSAGTLLWQPNWSDVLDAGTQGFRIGNLCSFDNDFNIIYGSGHDAQLDSISVDGHVIIVRCAYGSSFPSSIQTKNSGSTPLHFGNAPITGAYSRPTATSFVRCDTFSISGQIFQFSSNFGSWSADSRITSLKKGSGSLFAEFSSRYPNVVSLSNPGGSSIIYIYTPIFSVVPTAIPGEDSVITNNYYISTRVNNFNGDYYDSVTNNYYNNTTIVNETTNNYYDITTNNNYTMSNWSYDYASRTYFITLEDGTTVTVQFGDDCMTITKNDVTNSYQYVIKNNSTPDTPTGCKHDWQETIDTAPTCLEGGHASYTCSLCGETYEQNLAAKGHDWKVIEHVNMVYNSDGTVATQGHTLYQCSVCGEQWYTDTGAPPPDVSGSSNILAWLTNFQTWLDGKFGLFVDKLQVVVDNSTSTVENTVINITQDNDAFNVFYIEDKDGNTQSVTEFAGDLTGASGKLLSLLYRLVFADALGGVDDDLDGFEDFFTSQEPVTDTATQSVDDTVNEVMNVWAS